MNDFVKSICACSEPYPDGQRITALEVEYVCAVDALSVKPEAFCVADRRVTGAVLTRENVVRLALDPSDQCAQTLSDLEGYPRRSRPSRQHGPGAEMPVYILPDGQTYRSPGGIKHQRLPLRVKLQQREALRACDGCELPPWPEEKCSDREENAVVDLFQLGEFADMRYALYVPENTEAEKRYPLVLFIHDAGCMGNDARITLEQGVGATIWAAPEHQRRHPCFVLAPQHTKPYAITNDDYIATPELETIKAMCDHIVANYPVDRRRIYVTGQSMGFMCSVELMNRYPDYFAAGLAVAGHWDRPRTAALHEKNLWMFISEQDSKGVQMFVLPEMLREKGLHMGVYHWSADQSLPALSALVEEAAGDGENYRLSIFTGDSIWRRSQSDRTDGGGHGGTWHLVYRIEGVREWLFAQTLE